MKLLKIKIFADGYERTNEAVISDGESVQDYIQHNIISELNKPRYFGHEISISVFVLDELSENSLIPLVTAGYFIGRSADENEAKVKCKWLIE